MSSRIAFFQVEKRKTVVGGVGGGGEGLEIGLLLKTQRYMGSGKTLQPREKISVKLTALYGEGKKWASPIRASDEA